MHERKLTEQELVRRDKALKLRELGYDPFGVDMIERIMLMILKKSMKV